MRKKERKGPGMVAVAASRACTPRSSDAKERKEGVPPTPGAKLAHKHATTTNGAERERGYFIAGTRPEPRDYPATGSASRQEAREQLVKADIVTLAGTFGIGSGS